MRESRGQVVLLSVVMVVLLAASVAVVRWQTAPRPRAQAEAATGAAPEGARLQGPARLAGGEAVRPALVEEGAEDLAAFLSETPDEYRVIAERNLFQPLLQPPAPPVPRPVRASAPALPAIVEPVVVEIEPLLEAPQPPPQEVEAPVEAPAEAPSGPPPDAPDIAIGRVAATGLVQKDGDWTVVLENLDSKEARFAYLGETHWSWKVDQIDPQRRQVVLRHGDAQHTLRMGQNKQAQEVKPAARPSAPAQQPPQPTPGQGGPPMMMGGGFPPGGFGGGNPQEIMNRLRERFGGNIPPEVQQRIQQRLGGGGGGGGGGRGRGRN